MRALLQRVKRCHVEVAGKRVGEIDEGLLVLVGVGKDDDESTCQKLLDKVLQLRIFEDEQGKMNRSLLDTHGQMLVVSQFTLWANCRKGRRPSFVEAGRPEMSQPLYEQFRAPARSAGVNVQAGEFGADMQVHLVNDGPVTIWLDTAELGPS